MLLPTFTSIITVAVEVSSRRVELAYCVWVIGFDWSSDHDGLALDLPPSEREHGNCGGVLYHGTNKERTPYCIASSNQRTRSATSMTAT